MKKRLSIAIPTKDRYEYLMDTLKKIVCNDEFNQIEIIIQDNSVFKSDIIKNYIKQFENVKYVSNTYVKSIDENMVEVAKHVETPYFLWLGDDDIILNLKKMLQLVEDHSDYDFILLNASILDKSGKKSLVTTLEIKEDHTYNDPREFFYKFWDKLPFGTLIVRKDLFEMVLEKSSRFNGTSHRYSGIIFDYLAEKYRFCKKVNIYVVSEPLVGLRKVKKTWYERSLDIFYEEIPIWFSLLDDLYKVESTKAFNIYIKKVFSMKMLIQQRCHSFLSLKNQRKYTKYASFTSKLKYLLISLFPRFFCYFIPILKIIKDYVLKLKLVRRIEDEK